MPRQAHLLWNYFTKMQDKEEAKCNKCGKVLGCKKATTSSLRHHLKAAHPMDDTTLQKAELVGKRKVVTVCEGEVNGAETTCKSPPSKRQRLMSNSKVTDYYAKYSLRDRRQLTFDMEVTKFLVRASLPFNLVESDAFKEFIAFMNSRLTVKSRKTFAGPKLKLLYDNMKSVIDKEILEDMDKCDMVSFTSDFWTSRSNDSFISLTLHYINNEFILKRWALGCLNFEGKHTDLAIARELDRMIKEIPGLKKTCHRMIVHDAATNMKLASTESDQVSSFMICFDHQINTSLAHAVRASTDLSHAINMATALASRSHQSSLATQAIREECLKQEVSYVKIIAPVKTRWNSNQMMIESILRMRSVFEELHNEQNKDVGDVIPSQSDFVLLEQLLPILTQMKKLSEECSVESKPTSHLAVSHLVNISHFLANEVQNDARKEPIKEFARHLLEQMKTRMPYNENGVDILKFAHFLHPFFKGALLKSENCFDSTVARLIENYGASNELRKKQSPSKSEPTFDGCLVPGDEAERIILELSQDEGLHAGSQLRREIDLYLTLPKPFERSKVDTLQWWKQQQSAMPILARLARGFFSVPLSSTSSERMFSASGNIASTSRMNLNPETISTLTYVQQNWGKVKVHNWNHVSEEDKEEEGSHSCTQSSSSTLSQESVVIHLYDDDYDDDDDNDGDEINVTKC